jgi:hypothetical protein
MDACYTSSAAATLNEVNYWIRTILYRIYPVVNQD